jgi:hypothetical protein
MPSPAHAVRYAVAVTTSAGTDSGAYSLPLESSGMAPAATDAYIYINQ